MSEIQTPLIKLLPGDTWSCSSEDGAYVITAAHSHSDILRFIAADVGASEMLFLAQRVADPS